MGQLLTFGHNAHHRSILDLSTRHEELLLQDLPQGMPCSGVSLTAVASVHVCRVKAIPGATVEHNKFCVSAHFRNCALESYDAVLAAVKETLQEHPNLKASRGRKVLEIQPQVCFTPRRFLLSTLLCVCTYMVSALCSVWLSPQPSFQSLQISGKSSTL